ncbi:hypothetical protein Aperf_G00000025078 [Anoplocephala perfoliata]
MASLMNSSERRAHEVIASARLRWDLYENVHSGIAMNRGEMKMANIAFNSGELFFEAAAPDVSLYICGGPGGFSENLTWRRGCSLSMASERRHGFQRIRGYGMTLATAFKDGCDFEFEYLITGPAKIFRAYYGDNGGNGDIVPLPRTIAAATAAKGVHVVMVGEGFNVSDGHNLQEAHLPLPMPLPSCVQLFDTFTDFTVDLLWLMSHVFSKIYIVKPITSRPANSERYLVCESLISPNECMAGCPAAPASVNDDHKKEPSNNPVYKRKLVQKNSRAMSSHNPSGSGDNEENGFKVDTTSAVGVLISHFLAAGEELHKLAKGGSEDLLRLAQDDALHTSDDGESFAKFITQANEKLAKRQCLYLSKMIVFSDDATKSDESQDELAKACLEKWQVPSTKREPLCWPLWSENISPALRCIIPEGRRYHALMALDAALIYGMDIQSLPLVER